MHVSGKRGFTLIEVITVIAIIVIIIGITTANFRSFSSQTALDEDAAELATLIRTARQNSISALEYNGGYPHFGVYITSSLAGKNPGNRFPAEAFMYGMTSVDLSDAGQVYAHQGAPPNTILVDPEGVAEFSPSVTVSGIRFAPAGSNFGSLPGGADNVSILFVRPDPIIIFSANTSRLSAGSLEITLQATDGETRRVLVNSSGRVSVQR